MSGIFNVSDTDPTVATNSTNSPLGMITLNAVMGSTLTNLPTTQSEFNEMTFTNSFRSCQTKAYRTNQTVASITNTLPQGAGSVSLQPYIGAWRADSSCVPSAECMYNAVTNNNVQCANTLICHTDISTHYIYLLGCCATGITYISPVSGSSNQVSAQTTLTGDGSTTSCMHEGM